MKSKFKLAKAVLSNFFSFRHIAELLYLSFYYSLNHVKGIREINIGKNVKIRPTVLLRDANRIYLGDGTMLNHNNILWAGKQKAEIRIGKNVILGPNVQIIAFNHEFSDSSLLIVDQGYREANIIIGENVWIGAGSIILPGVTVGDNTIIGAGSVVTKTMPPNSICVGNPAKVIKRRSEN